MKKLLLTALREALGWSQAELGRRACVHPSIVSSLESHRLTDPGERALRALAEALGFDVARAHKLLQEVTNMPVPFVQGVSSLKSLDASVEDAFDVAIAESPHNAQRRARAQQKAAIRFSGRDALKQFAPGFVTEALGTTGVSFAAAAVPLGWNPHPPFDDRRATLSACVDHWLARARIDGKLIHGAVAGAARSATHDMLLAAIPGIVDRLFAGLGFPALSEEAAARLRPSSREGGVQ